MDSNIDIDEVVRDVVCRFELPPERIRAILKKLQSDGTLNRSTIDFFTDALWHGGEKALATFERKSSPVIMQEMFSVIDTMPRLVPLLYNHEELKSEIGDALKWLRRNEKDLLVTGFATKLSGKETPLDVLIGRNYFTKIPCGLRAVESSTGYNVTYAWSCNYVEPEGEVFTSAIPPFWIRGFVRPSFRYTINPDIETHIEFNREYASGRIATPLKDSAEFITKMRPKVHNAKVEILEILQVAIKNGDHRMILKETMRVLSATFDRSEIQQIMELDVQYQFFAMFQRFGYKTITGPTITSQNGGIAELLWFVGYCEYELKTGYVARFRDRLGKFVHKDRSLGHTIEPLDHAIKLPEWAEPNDTDEIWLLIYLNATADEQDCVDVAFGELIEDSAQVVHFWREYSDRIDSALQSEFAGLVSIKTRLKFAHLLAKYAADLESAYAANGNLNFMASTSIQSMPVSTKAKYPLPEDTSWSKITISFYGGEDRIDSDFVRIKCAGMKSKKFRYSELGFNNAKNNSPNVLWELLIQFAKYKGEIKADRTKIEEIKSNMKRLRNMMKEITGLKEDPISYERGAYATQFTVQYGIDEGDDDRPESGPSDFEIQMDALKGNSMRSKRSNKKKSA